MPGSGVCQRIGEYPHCTDGRDRDALGNPAVRPKEGALVAYIPTRARPLQQLDVVGRVSHPTGIEKPLRDRGHGVDVVAAVVLQQHTNVDLGQ
jgi:hypothetical protein